VKDKEKGKILFRILLKCMSFLFDINDFQIESEMLSDRQLELLDPLLEKLEIIQKEIFDKTLLYTDLYLTPTQKRRWFLYFKLGTIKAVAEEEGVSTAAVHKSLLGTRDNESSRCSIKSPVDKIGEIIQSDAIIQEKLLEIKSIRNEINNIIEEYV